MIKYLIIYSLIIFSCKTEQAPTEDFSNSVNKIYNVKNFGAKGDFLQDDTKAIQKCFAEIEKNGGGIAYFPNGTYKVSRTLIPGKSWCLKGVSNIIIKGESKKGSIIKLASKQKNYTRMLVLEGSSEITIKNITFDGNLENQNNPNNPNEHLGAVFINYSNHINIINSNFINTGGDGISIRGVKKPSKNITITKCFFNNNQRNGITLGSGFDGVKIINNYFGKDIDDSPIDTEPTAGICQNVIIDNNIINTNSLLTLGGPSPLNTGKNFRVTNNKLNNCSIFMVNADSVLIKNNILNLTTPRKAAITCLISNENIYIQENLITINNKKAFYFVKTKYSEFVPRNIHVTNNTIEVKGDVNAFDIRGANNIYIENNTITGLNSKAGVYLFSNSKMNTIQIKNNILNGFKVGIKINPLKNNGIKNITIENNTFKENNFIAIDAKYNGRKELNLLENLLIKNNNFSEKIKTVLKK
ncbi:MAG: hypothetical protein L3J09_05515 [Flavobacteriaceae bacterium]|nr:hypothetical protein [Flavobacteriaceae bacterium]